MSAPGVAATAGATGFQYNRTNYKFDQTLRWKRFVAGRQFTLQQFGMFREDVTDLSDVAINKLKIYAPIMTLGCAYCLVVLVEGRSGLKSPGPPVFISGLYFQCIAIAFCFFVLGTWLAFHAALCAQIAAAQLRTRKVRLPVPSQRQLDAARKLMSSFEEQGVYDMFKLPFIMPNSGKEVAEASKVNKKGKKGYEVAGLPGAAAKLKSQIKEQCALPANGLRVPGFTSGNPSWINAEVEAGEAFPHAAASGYGNGGPTEPYEHFELVREAQKEWWCAEAYMRICCLFGFMHLLQAMGYWVVLHCVSELLMIWCANLSAAALTAAVWIIFRMDVLPESGGCYPIEAGGPFMAAVTMALMYTLDPRQPVLDISRGIAIFIVSLQIVWTFRLIAVSTPAGMNPDHTALEAGGHLFNHSGPCEKPAWLPNAFQHVTYMVSPPKTQQQLAKEKTDREGKAIENDEMITVNMVPWFYVRAALLVTVVGWGVQLGGLIVEATMGERTLVTIPGQAPWSRATAWFGFEHGPLSSKMYAHMTPAHGHFGYQPGWGPNGQQELWPSDLFGFHPEADAWWSELNGPQPQTGIAGAGDNTWAALRLNSTHLPPRSPPAEVQVGVAASLSVGSNVPYTSAGTASSNSGYGWSRRLRPVVEGEFRPVVPASVRWPSMLEPELIVCGSSPSSVLAFARNGLAALVSTDGAAASASFALDGLAEMGDVLAATWGKDGLLLTTSSGAIAACPRATAGASSSCTALEVPAFHSGTSAVAVFDMLEGQPLRAAIAIGGKISVVELVRDDSMWSSSWKQVSEVLAPAAAEGEREQPLDIVALAAGHNQLLATASDGSVLRWQLVDGRVVEDSLSRDTPAVISKTWRSACQMTDGKLVRLATSWRRDAARPVFQPELFL